MGEAAPAAADLEHAIFGAELELLADAPVLAALGVRQRLVDAVEDGAGVGHRLVEHQLEQVVAEVVVVGDVAACAQEAVASVQPRPRLEQAAPAGVPLGGRCGVAEQELEQPDEVVAVPFARRVRLADPELAARRDPAEERVVVDRQRLGCAAPEPPHAAAWQPNFEHPALEVLERTLENRDRDALEQRRPCGLGSTAKTPFDAAHLFTEPWPGTKAGLRWNGTRFSQSRSACQWIRRTTRIGIRG